MVGTVLIGLVATIGVMIRVLRMPRSVREAATEAGDRHQPDDYRRDPDDQPRPRMWEHLTIACSCPTMHPR